MKKIICFFAIAFTINVNAKDIELKTTITDVTVFQSGAQVKRIGSINIPAGESIILIKDATALLKKESIQVKGEGNFTIISINHQQSIYNQKTEKDKIKDLEAKLKDIKQKMEDLSLKLEVIRTEEDIINNLQLVSTATEGIKVEQVTKAEEVMKIKLEQIKNEKLSITRQMNKFNDEYTKLNQQIISLKTEKKSVDYEIAIKVFSKNETKASFDISYIVPNARWFPSYDLRVKTINDPLIIDYKANVIQQTGEDWTNVNLRISTGDPSLSSQKPQVTAWWLYLNQTYQAPQQKSNYYKYTEARFTKVYGTIVDKKTGEAIPYCNVMVDESSIGTTTDDNGNYSLVLPENAKKIKVTYVGYNTYEAYIDKEEIDVFLEPAAELDEVEIVQSEKIKQGDSKDYNSYISVLPGVSGKNKADYASVTPEINLVNAEFVINEKYSIISSPKSIIVQMQSIESKATYQYYCAPRLDKDVFLTALMTNWEQYNLLEGQANIFFEGTFIGSTLLDTRYLKDTLEVSLGRDKSVKVERIKSKEYNKHRMLGADNIAYREWNITAKNAKQQSINIIIEDQFPLAASSKIDVKQEEKGDGKLNSETGVVTWQYQMDAGSTKKTTLKYTVKYPKDTFIGLD